MKKVFLIIFFFGLYCTTNAQEVDDTIHWNADYKLKWIDFRGVPDYNSGKKAITYTNIKHRIIIKDSTFEVNIFLFFDKRKSWTLSKDQNLLSHEQGHFDITEIIARKMRKAFKEYKYNNKTIEDDYKRIIKQLNEERVIMNDLYDKETNYSRDLKGQKRWNNKIINDLKKLEEYKK